MDIHEILDQLKSGRISTEEAAKRLRLLAIKQMENSCLDISRKARKGIPEIILAEGKSNESLFEAINALLEENQSAVVTRVAPSQVKLIIDKFKKSAKISYYEKGRVVAMRKDEIKQLKEPPVAIITAGSADISVAEEARAVINEMGIGTLTFYDVGIAGLHRILPVAKKCMEKDVDVAIVVAGMEGALPSIFSSLFPGIVIGVPSSAGYGHGGRGEGALTTMLQSCTPGLVVVNIDNGVGAAVAATLISRLRSKPQ